MVLVVGTVAVADGIAVHRTESTIASNIEHRFPGSHAHVTVSSSPFLVRLAAAGTVEKIQVHVTGLAQGTLDMSAVDVTVHRLRLKRSALLHGKVELTGMSSATIAVTLTLSDLLRDVGASIAGPGATGSVVAGPGGVTVSFGALSFRFSYTSLITCVGSARLTGTSVVLSCTTKTIPPALRSAA